MLILSGAIVGIHVTLGMELAQVDVIARIVDDEYDVPSKKSQRTRYEKVGDISGNGMIPLTYPFPLDAAS